MAGFVRSIMKVALSPEHSEVVCAHASCIWLSSARIGQSLRHRFAMDESPDTLVLLRWMIAFLLSIFTNEAINARRPLWWRILFLWTSIALPASRYLSFFSVIYKNNRPGVIKNDVFPSIIRPNTDPSWLTDGCSTPELHKASSTISNIFRGVFNFLLELFSDFLSNHGRISVLSSSEAVSGTFCSPTLSYSGIPSLTSLCSGQFLKRLSMRLQSCLSLEPCCEATPHTL